METLRHCALNPPAGIVQDSIAHHENPQVIASPLPFSISLAGLIRSESRLNFKISFRDTGESFVQSGGSTLSNASSIGRSPILAGQRRVTVYETCPMIHFDQTEQALDELRYDMAAKLVPGFRRNFGGN